MVRGVLDDSRPTPRPPFASLQARLAGLPADESLCYDVPPHLDRVLSQWLTDVEDADLDDQPPIAVRVSLQLGITPPPGISGRGSLAVLLGADRLDVVDAALHLLDPGVTLYGDSLEFPLGSHGDEQRKLLQRLDHILGLGRSAYRVADSGRQLEHRLDPTITTATTHAIATAPLTAGALLRDAWDQAHGLHPDSTAAYRQAVRAVEEVLCPLVLPDDHQRTLGKALGHLHQGGRKWRFVLVDREGADTIDPLVAMLDRLWTGQVSRHGGGRNSRDQTQVEAEAAVQLAATLVQLLSTGALSRRVTS